MAQYDVDLRDYWRILKKRKRIVILMVILTGISSYLFAKLREPVPLYKASSSVKIEQKFTMGEYFMGALWNDGVDIETQAYIISSFPVLAQAAKMLDRLPESITMDEIRDSVENIDVIQQLKSMITAEQENYTDIINITAVSNDKNEAAVVANTVAGAFKKYNVLEKNRQTFETRAFIEEQLRQTEAALKNAENELRSYKENYGLVALDAQTNSILSRMSSVELEYDKTVLAKSAVKAQLESLNRNLESLEQIEAVFSPEAKDTPVQLLNAKLHDLILKRQALLFDFTEKHPQVKEIDDKINGVTREIKKELESLFKIFSTREKDLVVKLGQLKSENHALPEKALYMERLQREVSIQESLYSQLKTKYQEVQIQASGKIEEVSIVLPALVPKYPYNMPSKIMKIITGTIMGLIIGIVFTFIAETLDTSIGTIEDVESLLGVPVLGIIPFLEGEAGKLQSDISEGSSYASNLTTHYDPDSLVSEAFRTLRTNLQFMGLEKKGHVFLMTSSFLKEGKSFNVANLALTLAQAGKRVLLIEGDLRKSSIHKLFGLRKEPGLSDYVLENCKWREIVNNITDIMLGEFEVEDILKTPGIDNLNIITSGTYNPNASEIIRSDNFDKLISEARNEYDIILIDAPPILPVADACEIAPLADGVMIVYKVGEIGRGMLKRAKASLDNAKANVLGVILNGVRSQMGLDYFKYQSYTYYTAGEGEDLIPETTLLKRFVERIFSYKLEQINIRHIILTLAIALLIIGIFWNSIK